MQGLLAAGADLYAQNKDGLAPVHLACQRVDNPRILIALLEQDVNAQGSPTLHHTSKEERRFITPVTPEARRPYDSCSMPGSGLTSKIRTDALR